MAIPQHIVDYLSTLGDKEWARVMQLVGEKRRTVADEESGHYREHYIVARVDECLLTELASQKTFDIYLLAPVDEEHYPNTAFERFVEFASEFGQCRCNNKVAGCNKNSTWPVCGSKVYLT